MDAPTTTRVAKALAEAEKNLQLVIGETAKSGDYSLSKAASGVAEEVRRIRASLPETKPEAPAARLSAHSSLRRGQLREQRTKSKATSSAKHTRTSRPTPARKAPRPSGYPRFDIRRDNLHRIGWSRKEKEEYVHKAPHEAFEQAIDAMLAVSQGARGPFMAEEFLSKLQELDGNAPPSYQVYVVIGFLRHMTCIEQVGREGYLLPTDLKQVASRAWDACAADAAQQ